MNTKAILILFVALISCFSCTTQKTEQPNIVIILADDMGYGDLQSYNPNSTIPTPNLTKFSEEGIMFTDAHTPSSVCTPTRYGLLTGRYCWRTRLKKGVLFGYSSPLVKDDRATIASYLKDKGYITGVVGKWHLGLGFQQDKTKSSGKKKAFDLTQPLYSSPNNNGFDYSYVLPASLDFEPYIYVRNKKVVDTDFDMVEDSPFPDFWRKGIKSKSLDFDNVLDDFLVEAKTFIKKEAKTENPFFLYFPLSAPHTPVVPTDKFEGTSGKGVYGDFISQVDYTAGEILRTLTKLGIDDNTLVIFTSDNGSPMKRTISETEPDHVSNETLQYYNANNHESNGFLSGVKGDVLEGGHRVPFMVRWPTKFAGGQTENTSICLTDIFETIIDATKGEKPEGCAEDSYSFYPILSGERESINRPAIIHHSGKGMFAMRKGNWKMIFGNGSGARTEPIGEPFAEPFQLYNMKNDNKELHNLIEKETKVAEEMKAVLSEIRGVK